MAIKQDIISSLAKRTVPVLPVIEVEKPEEILPIAEALAEGGIHGLEITLRTKAGLGAIELAAKEISNSIVCAGTVTSDEQLKKVANAGAEFVVTPGLTESLLKTADELSIELLPGIATPSELMIGLDAGLTHFKLFPAAIVGGIPMIRAMAGPFPQVKFCPTGGIKSDDFLDYLALPNVFCVGGTWMIVKSNGVFQSTDSRLAARAVSEALAGAGFR